MVSLHGNIPMLGIIFWVLYNFFMGLPNVKYFERSQFRILRRILFQMGFCMGDVQQIGPKRVCLALHGVQCHGEPTAGPTPCGERLTDKAIVFSMHLMLLGGGNVLALIGTPDGVADAAPALRAGSPQRCTTLRLRQR